MFSLRMSSTVTYHFVVYFVHRSLCLSSYFSGPDPSDTDLVSFYIYLGIWNGVRIIVTSYSTEVDLFLP